MTDKYASFKQSMLNAGYAPADKPARITEQDAREIALSVLLSSGFVNGRDYIDPWLNREGRALLNKLNGDREQVTEGEAPSHSLPNWSECNLRVSNSKWLKDNDRKPEHDSLISNPLHEFIYEYDDSDAYKSAWFMHRLERLIDFVKSEQVPAVAVPDEVRDAIERLDTTQYRVMARRYRAGEGHQSGYTCGNIRVNDLSICVEYIRDLLSASPSHSQQSAVVVPDGFREIVEAVAHIGVDFGYGAFVLSQEHINKARELLAADPSHSQQNSDLDGFVKYLRDRYRMDVSEQRDEYLKKLSDRCPSHESEQHNQQSEGE